jgi:hypothetical protein
VPRPADTAAAVFRSFLACGAARRQHAGTRTEGACCKRGARYAASSWVSGTRGLPPAAWLPRPIIDGRPPDGSAPSFLYKGREPLPVGPQDQSCEEPAGTLARHHPTISSPCAAGASCPGFGDPARRHATAYHLLTSAVPRTPGCARRFPIARMIGSAGPDIADETAKHAPGWALPCPQVHRTTGTRRATCRYVLPKAAIY